jgi:hypothetical protein
MHYYLVVSFTQLFDGHFFLCKNLFAGCKYTHFSTEEYKNCSWSTNFLQNTRCARGHGATSSGDRRYSSEKMAQKKKHCSRVTFRKLTYASVVLVSYVTILAACSEVILLFRYALLFISEVSASSRRTFSTLFLLLCFVSYNHRS